MKRRKIDLAQRLNRRKRQRWLVIAFIGVLLALACKLAFNVTFKLAANDLQPADAIFVLGGSIRREVYAAELAKIYPELPILISQGSDDPCIWRIFMRANARLNNVWLEHCANSTFENFFFGVPIIQGWGVRKVKVITSRSHLPRAERMARIHFGAQGIAVEMAIASEHGVPGNRESTWKTRLDVARSLLWAVAAQVISPPCFNRVALAKIDWEQWNQHGYKCERQADL